MMKHATKARAVGRKPIGDDVMTQLAVRFPKEILARVDKIVAKRYGAPDKAAIIREAVAIGLEKMEAGK